MRVTSSSVRIVVFDLGGVLIRICRTWQEACQRIGVPVHSEWEHDGERERRRELSRVYHAGGLSTDEFCARMSATARGVYTADEVKRVHDAWLIDEYAGVSELIDDLHAQGVMTGVLSNTNEAHWRRLCSTSGVPAEFGLPSKVQHLHASHLLGVSKPDVACFQAFEERAGLARGAGVIFFDDLEENIAGAALAGWRGVLIDHRGDTAAQMRRALADARVL